MTLDELLAQLIAEAGDVQITDKHEYSRSGALFLVHPELEVVELRIGADIAEAARRTPDTAASARGEDWVRFAPSAWEEHASDRLQAWFRVAWRLAGPG